MRITCISNRLAEIDFHNRYFSGERSFSQAKLGNVNLSNKTLIELDLRQANLDYSTLEGIKLSGSDLTEASLISANLKKTSISNTMFNRANLTNAKLSLSTIADVSFFGACLYKASFGEAKVNNLDLSFANLSAAYLAETDLSDSMLEGAIYNSSTAFVKGFNPEQAGMIHESKMFDVDQIMTQFNTLHRRAKNLLGDKIAAKYLDSSRPKYDGLDKLKTDSSKIVFKGDVVKSLNYVEAEYLRQWMIVFANMCYSIVSNVGDNEELFSNGIFA